MLSSCSDIIEFQEFGIGFVAAMYSIHASSAIGWTQERKASQNIDILKSKSILHLELATVYLCFFPQTYLVIARVPRATHKRWNHVHLAGPSQTDDNWQQSKQVHHWFLNDRIFNRVIPEFHFHKNNRYAMQRYRAFLQTFLSNLCRAVIFNERSHTAAPWDFRIYFLSSRLASPPSSCMMSYGMLTSSVCEFSSFIVVDLSICRFLPTYAGPFWCADELAEPPQYCDKPCG